MGRKEPFFSLRNSWSDFLLFADRIIQECLALSLLLFCVAHNSCQCCCCSAWLLLILLHNAPMQGIALNCFHLLETLLTSLSIISHITQFTLTFSFFRLFLIRHPRLFQQKIRPLHGLPKFLGSFFWAFSATQHQYITCDLYVLFHLQRQLNKCPNNFYSISHF